jgi:uracil-DNA glycosylase
MVMPDRLPLLWNAVLHHPHDGGHALRNRTLTRREIAGHRRVLELIVEAFKPRYILAIGRIAEWAARGLAVPTAYVRHPARGGASAFQVGVKAYLLERTEPARLNL